MTHNGGMSGSGDVSAGSKLKRSALGGSWKKKAAVAVGLGVPVGLAGLASPAAADPPQAYSSTGGDAVDSGTDYRPGTMSVSEGRQPNEPLGGLADGSDPSGYEVRDRDQSLFASSRAAAPELAGVAAQPVGSVWEDLGPTGPEADLRAAVAGGTVAAGTNDVGGPTTVVVDANGKRVGHSASWTSPDGVRHDTLTATVEGEEMSVSIRTDSLGRTVLADAVEIPEAASNAEYAIRPSHPALTDLSPPSQQRFIDAAAAGRLESAPADVGGPTLTAPFPGGRVASTSWQSPFGGTRFTTVNVTPDEAVGVAPIVIASQSDDLVRRTTVWADAKDGRRGLLTGVGSRASTTGSVWEDLGPTGREADLRAAVAGGTVAAGTNDVGGPTTVVVDKEGQRVGHSASWTSPDGVRHDTLTATVEGEEMSVSVQTDSLGRTVTNLGKKAGDDEAATESTRELVTVPKWGGHKSLVIEGPEVLAFSVITTDGFSGERTVRVGDKNGLRATVVTDPSGAVLRATNTTRPTDR